MATLNANDIDKIAHLAKLIIPKNENAPLLTELNKILDMVAEMSQTNTETVLPLAHPYDEKQPLREDKVTEPNQRELFQKLAPKTEAGFYIVPAVIENKEK